MLICFAASLRYAAAADVNVELSLAELHCLKQTQNDDRDEVFLIVYGDTPSGVVNVKLPRVHDRRDDYYQFWAATSATQGRPATWTNQDARGMGAPQIWSGSLKEGESATFLVAIAEQDNKDKEDIKKAVKAGLVIASTVLPAASAALPLADKLPDTNADDFIGSFAIKLNNSDGKLVTEYAAAADPAAKSATIGAEATKKYTQHGGTAALFDFKGTNGSHYQGIAWSRDVPWPPHKRRVYRERDADDFNAGSIEVPMYDEHGTPVTGTVVRGTQRLFRARYDNNGRLVWHETNKPENKGRMRPSLRGAPIMVIDYQENGHIEWYEFSEEEF